MAVTMGSTAVRNAILDALVDRCDLGSTNATGRLLYKIAAGNIAARILMLNPAFPAASGGSASLNGTPLSDTAAIGNAASVTEAHFTDRDESTVFKCAVTLAGGGGDITMSSTTINANDTVTINSFTINAPA